MLFTSWLRTLRSTRAAGRIDRNRRRSRLLGTATRCRPQLESLADRCLLSFGTGGVVITDIIATAGEGIESVVLQADGRIVVAGSGAAGNIARYGADGALDTSFNGSGSQPGVITPPGMFNSVALQGDGKIVAGGRTWGTADDSFLVRRYSADGTADSTFGSNGAVTTNFTKGKTDEIYALAIQPVDQKIVAVGYSNDSWAGSPDWTVVRYNTNGSLDTSFDHDGKLTTTFGNKTSAPRPRAVVVQSDGKILVAGEVYGGTVARYDFAVTRYNTDGSLDQTFGQGGKVRTDFASERGYSSSNDKAYDLAVQTDGKIVVVGHSGSSLDRVAVARFNADGSLDRTFDGNGMVILDVQTGGVARFDGVAIAADGKIVAVGGGNTSLVTRFNADGSLDASFDGDGLKYSVYASDPSFASDVLVQPDGKILVGGSTGWDSDAKFALARLNDDGSFDVADPLVAASGPATTGATEGLTAEQVLPLLDEARARWSASGVETSALQGIDIRITDLAGATLGLASDSTIWLDDNAAGWGWFVDATPGNDSEYHTPGDQGEQGRMDLLTAVAHEVGHLLGFDHSEFGVMHDTLDPGVRTLPAAATAVTEPAVVDSILAIDWTGRQQRHRDEVPESISRLFRRFDRIGLHRVR
jgi:uncharacterized delta-60 repeat protein